MIIPKDFNLSPTKDRQINLQLNFPDVGRVFNVASSSTILSLSLIVAQMLHYLCRILSGLKKLVNFSAGLWLGR